MNDPNTVIITNNLESNKDQLVMGSGNKGITRISFPSNSIVLVNADGTYSYLRYDMQYMKAIGTDGSGNIILIDRSSLI